MTRFSKYLVRFAVLSSNAALRISPMAHAILTKRILDSATTTLTAYQNRRGVPKPMMGAITDLLWVVSAKKNDLQKIVGQAQGVLTKLSEVDATVRASLEEALTKNHLPKDLQEDMEKLLKALRE